MGDKKGLSVLKRNISTGMAPGFRYFLAATMIGLSIGLLALSSYLIVTPVLYQDDVLKEATHWTSQNCSNRLEEHQIAHMTAEEGLKVWLETDRFVVGRNDLMTADVALLTCPGMEMVELCAGGSCPEQFLLLQPKAR